VDALQLDERGKNGKLIEQFKGIFCVAFGGGRPLG